MVVLLAARLMAIQPAASVVGVGAGAVRAARAAVREAVVAKAVADKVVEAVGMGHQDPSHLG